MDEFSASVCRFLTKLSSINKPRVNKRDDVEGGYFGHHQGDRSDSFDSFKDDAMMDNGSFLIFRLKLWLASQALKILFIFKCLSYNIFSICVCFQL